MAGRAVHRGTPFNHAGNSLHGVGMREHAAASGMTSTVLPQYESEKGGYRNADGTGTPLQHQKGNPPDARREVARGTNLESSDHGNQNDPRSNGKGVILDGQNEYRAGYQEPAERKGVMDSPVPAAAPIFDADNILIEDRAHMGRRGENQANDNILAIGGVLSRGMESTSRPSDHDEEELIHDDELTGRQQESVKHETE